MNLLRSICCLFGSRCAEEKEPKATNERSVAADLGQEEAELEKTGKEQMSHSYRVPILSDRPSFGLAALATSPLPSHQRV
jgi:hypothetical protein